MCLSNAIKLFFFCFAIYFVQTNKLSAQTIYQLPPNQPEQDACNALQLCGSSFSTPYSYTGIGKTRDLDSTPCLLTGNSGEVNSVWLQVHTSSAGNIVFTIKPVNPADDYDFAVINITGKDCNSITSKDVVRCNFNSNQPHSNVDGIIGLSDTSRIPYVQAGTIGESFGQAVFATSDEVYLIMINNYGNYVSGGPSQGFTIDFSGSTASFYNPATPELKNIDEVCNDNSSLVVTTTSEILCSSIAADGSDFTTNAPASIISASGINCNDRGGYTNSIMLHFSSPLPAGTYTINVKKGTDNQTIKGLCGSELSLSSTPLQFIVKPGSKVSIENESICYQQLPYLWNGMQLTNGGDSAATYTAKSSTGCDSITILNLQISQPPEQVNLSERICDGDSYVLPWNATVKEAGTYTHHYTNANGCDSLIESVVVTVFTPTGGNVDSRDSTIQTGFCKGGSVLLDGGNGFTSYLWNTGQTASSIVVNIAGSYGLEAKDPYGCTTIDTFVVALYPRPTADFNEVENLCADSVVVLDGGRGYESYLWEDGSTNETVTTNRPGIFWVRLTDTRNCTGTDTVHVVTVQRPTGFLINSVTKCALKNVTLSPINNFDSYAWNNGATTKSNTVSSGGLYSLTVTDYNGCTGKDSITVVDSTCPVFFFMPNAFTPNNDGHNDLFRPKFSGAIAGYHFSIYNRWGQLVFSTRDAEKGWDGTINGSQQPVDTYMWICSYSLDGQSIRTDRGTVTLLR